MRASFSRFAAAATGAAAGGAAEPAVLTTDTANTRLVTINRPKALNSMCLSVVDGLHKAFIDAPHSNPKALYIIRGAGNKSFCAGGDIIEQTAGDVLDYLSKWTFYQSQTDYHILTSTNTVISILNGYVMGGCAGIAFNGRYRVATDNTLFSMPECTIGYFPNGGASWLLPRAAFNGLGLYMGLTGARLKGADVVHAGFATHFVAPSSIDKMQDQLLNIADPFHASSCLAENQVKELPPFTLEKELPLIERVFTLKPDTTVEGIVDALKSEESDFAKGLVKTISACCPTSLKLTLEQQKRTVKMETQLESIVMEMTSTQFVSEDPNFKEGVRALLVDKTKDPKWKPATLAEVTQEIVNKYVGEPKKGYVVFAPTGPLKRKL